MPPHNFFDSDSCDGAVSMGQLFNSLLSSSINTLSPMCNDSSGPRVYSPTYPMNQEPASVATSSDSCSSSSNDTTSTTQQEQPAATSSAPVVDIESTAPLNPRRPPLNPAKQPKATTKSFRNRKKFGLSITAPLPSSSDRHADPDDHHGDESYPPRVSCSTNVELRRKSLSERHFFRPVSEDEESTTRRNSK